MAVPGKLVWNPTAFTGSYPYGGTGLGLMAKHEVRFQSKTFQVQAEEWGVASDVLIVREAAVLGAILRDYDPHAVALVFPDGASGVGGARIASFSVDGTARMGLRLSTRAGRLLFAPLSPDQHPFVYFPAAAPMRDETAALRLGWKEGLGLPVLFTALPDAEGRLYRVGMREDFDL
jgi:hypothetical protein